MVCFPIFYTLCAIQCRGQTETDDAGVLTQVQLSVSLQELIVKEQLTGPVTISSTSLFHRQ